MARSKYKKHSEPEATADDPHSAETISRSARKRESEALKAFGLALAELSTRQLEECALPEELFKAITDYQRITSNGARRRQRGFIGGLLRSMSEEDVNALRSKHTALTQHDANAKRLHQELEDWRERLLAEDEALTAFIDRYPGASARELRALIRRVRSAKNPDQTKLASRALYRKLADIAQA